MPINIGPPELSLLRARVASLETRLKEETATYAQTTELPQEAVARADTTDMLRLVLENMPD